MISVTNLKKTYQNIPALNGINFEIQKGEVFGLLGPNGAGKTTTINIVSTVLKPDAGQVIIDGHELKSNHNECKMIIGVVPQEIALYENLSAYDNLLFWGSLYSIEKNTLKKNIDTTLTLMGLADRKNDKIKTYSGGMKRRINIASALLHSPKILFMDEPTVGIDPQSRNLIYEVIRKLNSDGMTFIYTTHYMEEAEHLCNRVAIIDKGEIIAQGNLDELRQKTKAEDSIQISLRDGDNTEKIENLKTILHRKMNISGNTLIIFISNTKTELSMVLTKIFESGLEVEQIEINKANLESIFLKLTGKQLRD